MSGTTGWGTDAPVDRWTALGTGGGTVLERVELLEVELPFIAPVRSAVHLHRRRPLVLVHLIARDAAGRPVEGWGECAALDDPSYDREDAATAFASLRDDLGPALLRAADGGTVPALGDLGPVLDSARGPLAAAALEMAIADLHLRASQRSFADLLGVAGRRVTPGAVLGLPASADALEHDLCRLRSAGYARVKVKTAPGTEEVIAAAVRRLAGTDLRVQVDANGSYGADAAGRLAVLDDLGLTCIEQPLGRDDLDGHRRLARSLATPICLDESLDTVATVVDAVTTGACAVVCVKPARLGGVGAALAVIAWCGANDVPWWIGGMFESGFARGVNRSLGALPGPSLPGDLSPPESYLVGDLVLPVVGGIDAGSGHLSFPVPGGPGLGPPPDADLLAGVTTGRASVGSGGP